MKSRPRGDGQRRPAEHSGADGDDAPRGPRRAYSGRGPIDAAPRSAQPVGEGASYNKARVSSLLLDLATARCSERPAGIGKFYCRRGIPDTSVYVADVHKPGDGVWGEGQHISQRDPEAHRPIPFVQAYPKVLPDYA